MLGRLATDVEVLSRARRAASGRSEQGGPSLKSERRLLPTIKSGMSQVATSRARRLVNPVQGDVVTFLETSEETGGKRTLAELEVAPGGKVTPHYHLSYSERFRVLEGRLRLQIGDTRLVLQPGDEATVPIGALHTWANHGAQRAVAQIELRPGQPGFETALRVVYGLAADGRVGRSGVPRNPLHAALVLAWGDTRLPGAYSALERALRLLAYLARRAAIDRKLKQRYTTGRRATASPRWRWSSRPLRRS
jgi:mannose-6-phosphate isomerase-like protein (cupin superfamily)